jgi:hypothetical protein
VPSPARGCAMLLVDSHRPTCSSVGMRTIRQPRKAAPRGCDNQGMLSRPRPFAC